MLQQQQTFITRDLFSHLKNIGPATKALWGKMNAQQMVEHLDAFFQISIGKIHFSLVTPEEHLPKFKAFLLSEKQFRENTKAPDTVLGEEPLPLQYGSFDEAVARLHETVEAFPVFFKNNPGKNTTHPVFGPLDFDEWVMLHYKHVTHHLRQFGISC